MSFTAFSLRRCSGHPCHTQPPTVTMRCMTWVRAARSPTWCLASTSSLIVSAATADPWWLRCAGWQRSWLVGDTTSMWVLLGPVHTQATCNTGPVHTHVTCHVPCTTCHATMKWPNFVQLPDVWTQSMFCNGSKHKYKNKIAWTSAHVGACAHIRRSLSGHVPLCGWLQEGNWKETQIKYICIYWENAADTWSTFIFVCRLIL